MSVPSGSAVRQVQWLIYVLLALQAASAALSEESNESVMLSLQYRNARDLREMFADVKTLIARQAQQDQQASDVKTLIARQDQQASDITARLDSMDSRLGTMENAIITRLDTLEREQTEQAHVTMSMLSNELKMLLSWGCEDNKTGLSKVFAMDSVINVPCDGQGWVVFQRRVDGAFDFPKRTWDEYKRGFGDYEGSFWLGLEAMHRLTSNSHAMLRVELTSFEGETRYAEYTSFRIEGEEAGYRLHVSGYSGTAGDSLEYHNGMKFSTIDRDQDTDSGHCAAEKRLGAWWYKHCTDSNLNSVYRPTGIGPMFKSKLWYKWLGTERSYKTVAMKLRFK